MRADLLHVLVAYANPMRWKVRLMTTPNYVQIPPNSSGLKIDTSELAVSGNTVERQNVVLADPAAAGGLANIDSAAQLVH